MPAIAPTAEYYSQVYGPAYQEEAAMGREMLGELLRQGVDPQTALTQATELHNPDLRLGAAVQSGARSVVPPGSQAPGRVQINFRMPDGSTQPYFAEPSELTGNASPLLQQILASGGLPIDPQTGAPLQKGPMVNGGNVWVNPQGTGISLAQLTGVNPPPAVAPTPTLTSSVTSDSGRHAANVNGLQSSPVTHGHHQTRIIWRNPNGRIETGLPDGSDPFSANSMDELKSYMKQHGETGYIETPDQQSAINIVRQYTGNPNYSGYSGPDYKPPTPQAGSPAAGGGSFDDWFDSYSNPYSGGGAQGGGQPAYGLGPLLQPFTVPFTGESVYQPGSFDAAYVPGQFPYGYLPTIVTDKFTPIPFTDTFSLPTKQEVLEDPGYQFGYDEAMKAIQRSAAAKGTLLNPDTVRDMAAWLSDYGMTRYNDIVNRRLNELMTNYNIWGGREGAAERAFNTNTGTAFQNEGLKQAALGLNLGVFNTNEANRANAFNTNYGIWQGNEAQRAQNYNRSLGEYSLLHDVFKGNQNDIFNKLSGLAGTGQASASFLGNLGANVGANAGNIALSSAVNQGAAGVGGANALASGNINATNARTGMWNNVSNTLQNWGLMRQFGLL